MGVLRCSIVCEDWVDGKFDFFVTLAAVFTDELIVGMRIVRSVDGWTIHDVEVVTSIGIATNGLIALMCMIEDAVGKLAEGRMVVEVCWVVCHKGLGRRDNHLLTLFV